MDTQSLVHVSGNVNTTLSLHRNIEGSLYMGKLKRTLGEYFK